MQFCWIGLQIETKNTGAVVLRRDFSTKICRSRRRKCAFVILETYSGGNGFDKVSGAPLSANKELSVHGQLFVCFATYRN
jgi:hypothetical protein